MFQILLINEKSELIKSLLNDINENKYNWNENVKALALQTIKVLGRDTKGCDYLFSEEGFKILLNHADNIISQESLTCIANSLLLKDSTRNLFEKYNCIFTSFVVFKNENLSTRAQFLLSRILFIITVSSLSATKQLVDDLGIIDVLYKNISNIVKELSSLDYDSKKESSSPYTNEMILNEQLKLLFNLMMNYPKLASLYHCNNDDKENNNDKGKVKENNTKFDILLPPILEIILELKPPSPLPLSPPHSHAIHALLNFPTITPLIVLLKRLAEGNQTAKLILRNNLLPDDVDRTKPLEKGDSLSARLIRVMTSVLLPNLKESISNLLFTLCDEDDEEKEREAEKLFVLFDRLKKTGVMNVVDPIEAAIKSVRFPIILQNEDIAGLVLEALKMMRVDDSALNGGRDIDNKSMVFIFQKVEHLADCAHGFPVWTRRQIEFPDIAHAVIRINKLLASGSFEVEKCD
ncbi:4722_t:CDS:10 [Entrophospora sp. SA101]|nr:4722_t:CDS:10 [Entrophospora sp. SA101]